MAEGIIPGPNFKFQVRLYDIVDGGDDWGEWRDANPYELREEDGHLVFHSTYEFSYVQVRIVFLPEES